MFRVLCEKHIIGRQVSSSLVSFFVCLLNNINYLIFHNTLQENWCLPDRCCGRL